MQHRFKLQLQYRAHEYPQTNEGLLHKKERGFFADDVETSANNLRQYLAQQAATQEKKKYVYSQQPAKVDSTRHFVERSPLVTPLPRNKPLVLARKPVKLSTPVPGEWIRMPSKK